MLAALACGYIERKNYGPVRVTLFFEHHLIYGDQ